MAWHLLNVIALSLCCIFAFSCWQAFGPTTNADLLLPISFVWDVAHQPHAWHNHALARIPSLIPDLLATATLLLATGSVRLTIFLFGLAQFAAFVWIGGVIAAPLCGRSLAAGTSAMLLAASAALLFALAPGATSLGFQVVVPVTHTGPFLFAMAAALIAIPPPSTLAPWRCVALFGIGTLVYLSDRMLLAVFVLPLLCAWLLACLCGWLKLRVIAILAGSTAAGVLIGSQALRLLHRSGLTTEPAPVIALRDVLTASRLFLQEAPDFALAHAWGLAPPLLVFLLAPLLADRRRRRETLFVWCQAASCMLAALLFTAALYQDDGSYRYLFALWAWPLVFVAVALLRLPTLARYLWAPVAVLACAALVWFGASERFRIGFLSNPALAEHADIAACLAEQQPPLGLRAGLAGYWIARPVTIARDWTMQVDQITAAGRPYFWGNDRTWYSHSIANPALPPDYNFVITWDLDPAAIKRAFGAPDLIHPCAGTEIWLYRTPGLLNARLAPYLPPEPAQAASRSGSTANR